MIHSSAHPLLIKMPYRSAPKEQDASARVPLLADAGLITASTGSRRPAISHDYIGTLVRFTTLLGCLFGVLAALVTIGVTQLVVVGLEFPGPDSGSLNKLFFGFDVIWCLLVTVLARYVMQRILINSFQADQASEGMWQVLDLSMAIGTLTGVLLSGAALCFYLGYGFWDKVIMLFGSVAMVVLCAARGVYLHSDEFRESEEAYYEQGYENLLAV